MAASQWHKFYTSRVAAPPQVLFGLLSDMPGYGRWLPNSAQFGRTTDVDPYPVQLGSRYHDGKPDEPGKDWWGTVTGFQPPGSLDFHHTITVTQLRATVDVHIHYSFEPENTGTLITRWLVLDITMPAIAARSAVSSSAASTTKTCGPWRRSRPTPRHPPTRLQRLAVNDPAQGDTWCRCQLGEIWRPPAWPASRSPRPRPGPEP